MKHKIRYTTQKTPIAFLFACPLMMLIGCSSEPEKTPQELIIGKWEKTSQSLEIMNKTLADGLKIEKTINEYYLNGDLYIRHDYVEPTNRSENPKIFNIKYEFLLDNQIKYYGFDFDRNYFEISEIIEINEDTHVLKFIRDSTESNLNIPDATFKRID